MPVRPMRGSRLSMGVAAPQLGSLLALAKSKHFASCQFSIACKRSGAKQCVQQQQQERWGNRENGKDVSAKHSHSLWYSFSYSYSLSFQFHLALAFILDLHLIWLSPPQFASPGFGLAQFVYLAPSLHSTILRSARQKAHKYLCGAKTMRMPRRNSTAHLQMNRLMSAECGGMSPLLPLPSSNSPCLVYVAKFRQRTNWL